MMKKNDKKTKKSTYSGIKITLLSGLAVFVILLFTLTIASCIYYFLRQFGVVDKINYKTILFVDYAVVCTVVGFILSIIIVHRPAAKIRRLLDAMEQIANGDFSVRLSKHCPHEKMTNKTVDIFNNMACQLGSTEMLSHDFINNFSHEFKTPIASINGFAKLLKDDQLSEEEKNEYLDIIIQESERLSNLSINILTLSKLEQQSILTNKTDFNLSEQLRIIIGTLYPKWTSKNLDISFESEETHITANKEMLSIVWINMLDNAIKFSPENTTISIDLKDSKESVSCEFRNTGKQITSEESLRLFDKFYQGDKSHSTHGYGLGLAIVKRIIDLHGGQINIINTGEPIVAFRIDIPKK